MDWTLPVETRQLADTLTKWSDERLLRVGTLEPHEPEAWRELCAMGVLGVERAGGTVLDTAVGFTAAARAGLPGPLLEADLAAATGSASAVDALEAGAVVTSVVPGPAGPAMVGWGAVADLVVDQRDGAVVARGPLPPAVVAGHQPHGWAERSAGGADPLAARRWCLGAAVLVGLGRGALRLTVEHAKGRHQFGRPISSFQAVQFRLAECLNLLESAERSVVDAAWRLSATKPEATAAAALSWLWAEDASLRLGRHCHQVFGALGFCDEAGLIRLTEHAGWVRTSVGRQDATRWVLAHRRPTGDDPPSGVLGGFDHTPST